MTSQYVPAGRPVWKVRASGAPPSLKATYAAEPRPNAIWSDPFVHQSVTAAPAATFRRPTMFSVVRARCSHCQPLPQLTGDVVPSDADGGPASGSVKVKLDITWGTPYGQAIMNASASAYRLPSRYGSVARPLRWVSWLSMNATASPDGSRIELAMLFRFARLPFLNAAPTTSP